MYLVNFIFNNDIKQEIITADCGDEAIDIIQAKYGIVKILVVERYSSET
jgi:hypothetical protein